MVRYLLLSLLGVALLGLALFGGWMLLQPGDSPALRTKADQAAIQGTWEAQSSEEGGKDVPAGAIKGLRLTFEGENFFETKGDVRIDEGTFRLDAGRIPREIDLTTKERTLPGIYGIENDSLIVVVGREGKVRPTAFGRGSGTDEVSTNFRRAKK